MRSNDKTIGGELTDFPNDQYRKFYDKFSEIETLEVSAWKPAHLIGFFVKKYKEQYHVNYKLKFNSPSPSKCFEIFQIKKLAQMLSADPTLLKGYIDWVFEFKIIKAKRRITSISFLTIEEIVNDYKINVLLSNNKDSNIDRQTLLSDKFKIIFQKAGYTLSTYGELAFLFQSSEISSALINAMNEAKQQGFIADLSKVV
jgi:hypothetical protein